jgi:hypothetical protein
MNTISIQIVISNLSSLASSNVDNVKDFPNEIPDAESDKPCSAQPEFFFRKVQVSTLASQVNAELEIAMVEPHSEQQVKGIGAGACTRHMTGPCKPNRAWSRPAAANINLQFTGAHTPEFITGEVPQSV